MASQAADGKRLILMAVMVAACACGCDALYEVRIDVRAGRPQTVRVIDISDLDESKGTPVEGAAVDMTLEFGFGSNRVQHRGPLLTDEGGTVITDFTIGGMIWDVRAMNQQLVRFSCQKEGYVPVEGDFRLKGFLGTAGQHDQSVLVVMDPLQPGNE